jgi:hypothetical protein
LFLFGHLLFGYLDLLICFGFRYSNFEFPPQGQNPCFTGSTAERGITNSRQQTLVAVSILVLLEVPLKGLWGYDNFRAPFAPETAY